MAKLVLEYNTMTEVGAFLKGLNLGQTKKDKIVLIGVEDNIGCKTVVLEEYDDKATSTNEVVRQTHAGGDASREVPESGS